MSKKVTIVDYGVGNVFNVVRALNACDATVEVTSDIHQLQDAEKLILPGVGAFGDCMDEIKKRNLEEAIKKFATKERPLLGICVGMQVLFSLGFEFGEHKGLDLIPGKVAMMPKLEKTKLPYVGWAQLKLPEQRSTNFFDQFENQWLYFLHSYQAIPQYESCVQTQYEYYQHKITASVQYNHMLGCQFHPEKSGETGLKLLKKFVEQL